MPKEQKKKVIVSRHTGETMQSVTSPLDLITMKRLGQYFTPKPLSDIMAKLSTRQKSTIRFLDPGAGIGILTGSYVASLISRETRPTSLHLIAIEQDFSLISSLTQTLESCRVLAAEVGMNVTIQIIHEDFLNYASSLEKPIADVVITEVGRKAPRFEAGDISPVVRRRHGRASHVDIWYCIYMDYKHEQHCVHLVVYHIIWCPKRRRKMLIGSIVPRLRSILQEVAREHAWDILELAIQPDHVHLFVRATPYTLPSDIPRLMKGRSSRDLRNEFPDLLKLPSLWTRSYFLSTAGNVSSEMIQRYIAAQSTQ